MSGEAYLIEIFLPLADNLGRGFTLARCGAPSGVSSCAKN
jgi:hypothetical protein